MKALVMNDLAIVMNESYSKLWMKATDMNKSY